MLMFVIVAVFVAGPDGRPHARIPGQEDRSVRNEDGVAGRSSFRRLLVLIGTAMAVVGPGLDSRTAETGVRDQLLNNPGAHGFSEVLYAFSSAGNNNGSAFAGLTANMPFYNVALGIAMLVARYWLIDSDAGDRGIARAEEIHAAGCRHSAHAHAAVRGSAGLAPCCSSVR